MNRRFAHCLPGLALLLLAGCFSFKAPEKIEIDSGDRHREQDAAEANRKMPETRTLDDCHVELRRAYERQAALERELASRDREIRRLKDDVHEAKKDRDAYKDKLKAAQRQRD